MATNQEKVEVIFSVRDVASGVLKGIRGSFTELNSTIMLARQAWNAVAGSYMAMTKAAAESERTFRQLEAAAKRHNISWQAAGFSMKTFASQMQLTRNVSDELVAVGLQRLIDAGNSVGKSMQTVAVGIDFAKGAGLDAETAFDLLAKASMGATQTLTRYGIVLDESLPKAEKFEAALKQLNERFGGAAQAELDTYSGKLQALALAWDEFLEAGGRVVSAGGVLDEFTVRLRMQADIMNSNMIPAWKKWILSIESWVFVSEISRKSIQADIDKYLELEKQQNKVKAAVAGFKEAMLNGLIFGALKAQKPLDILAVQLRGISDAMMSINIQSVNTKVVQAQYGFQPTKVPELSVGNFGAAKAIKNDPLYKNMQDMKELWKNTTESMKAATASFVSNVADGFAEMVMGGKADFAQMAKDFIKMFISAAMKALLNFVALAVFHLRLFDKFENDMAIYKSGQDYAKFFTMGASDGFKGNHGMYAPDPGPIMARLNGGGFGGGNFNINLNVSGSSTFGIERQIIPVIEKAVTLNRSKILKSNGMRLGRLASEVM